MINLCLLAFSFAAPCSSGGGRGPFGPDRITSSHSTLLRSRWCSIHLSCHGFWSLGASCMAPCYQQKQHIPCNNWFMFVRHDCVDADKGFICCRNCGCHPWTTAALCAWRMLGCQLWLWCSSVRCQITLCGSTWDCEALWLWWGPPASVFKL